MGFVLPVLRWARMIRGESPGCANGKHLVRGLGGWKVPFYRGFRLLEAVLVVVVAAVSVGCLGPVAGVFPPQHGEPTESVFVVNHGWHTGVVVEARKFVSGTRPLWPTAAGCKYVEIGWGDEGFYRCEKVTAGIALRAMFGRNSAVLRVEVTRQGFDRLRAYLTDSYAVGERGRPIDLGKGIYGNSRFYRATGRYYFPNTCNRWTARALRSAGAPITPFYAVRAENVFRQASGFGTVMRDFSRD